MTTSIPQSPPPLPEDYQPPKALDDASEAKRVHVLDHFSKEDYKLQGTPLSDDEKFWLVRDAQVVVIGTEYDPSQMSAC